MVTGMRRTGRAGLKGWDAQDGQGDGQRASDGNGGRWASSLGRKRGRRATSFGRKRGRWERSRTSATRNMGRATRNMGRATRNMGHATRNMGRATRNMGSVSGRTWLACGAQTKMTAASVGILCRLKLPVSRKKSRSSSVTNCVTSQATNDAMVCVETERGQRARSPDPSHRLQGALEAISTDSRPIAAVPALKSSPGFSTRRRSGGSPAALVRLQFNSALCREDRRQLANPASGFVDVQRCGRRAS